MIRALFSTSTGTLVSFRDPRGARLYARNSVGAAHGRGVRIFIATGPRRAGDLGLYSRDSRDGVGGAQRGPNAGLRRRLHRLPPDSAADLERSMELAEELGFAVALEFDDGIFWTVWPPKWCAGWRIP